MEHSPSLKANTWSSSDSQEILCILWNLKVYYRFHKIPPLVPNLSHLRPTNDIKKNIFWRSVLILSSHLSSVDLSTQLDDTKRTLEVRLELSDSCVYYSAQKHWLTCVDVVCTVHVMSDVISSSLLSMRPQVVGSCLMLILSVMPPVRSARPSRRVPYFSASYDPCSLKDHSPYW